MTSQIAPLPPPPVRIKKTKTKAQTTVRRRPAKKKPQRHPHSKVRGLHGRVRRPVRRELSAGGVIARQERGQWFVALLKTEHKRGEVWVLPKGHVELDKNERISDAAKRECEEEAGVRDLSVKDQLGVTKFTFQAEESLVRKTVHYFLMITGQKTLVPQAEEGMIDAAWFPIDVAVKTLEYDTDQDIVLKAREKLTGQRAPVRRAPARAPRIHK
ncbi:MAG: NUDIX domain-containing protein [Candidatus Andersenbacteria bacterium]